MNISWEKGERIPKEKLKGKNGGTVFEQKVVKVYTPKRAA